MPKIINKKQAYTAVGVVLGTAIFKKFISPKLSNLLPSKGA